MIRTERHTESDPTALLVQFLVAFGVATGRRAHWPIEASCHYPNEFAVLVGPSGKGRKGLAWDHVEAIIAGADPAFAGDRLVSGLSSGEGLIAQVQDPDDGGATDAHTEAPAGDRGRVRTGDEGPRPRGQHPLPGRPQRVVRDLFSRNKKAREIDRALSALEDAGRLSRRSQTDGRGRPAEFWIPRVA